MFPHGDGERSTHYRVERRPSEERLRAEVDKDVFNFRRPIVAECIFPSPSGRPTAERLAVGCLESWEEGEWDEDDVNLGARPGAPACYVKQRIAPDIT